MSQDATHTNLLGLNLVGLEAFFTQLGEKPFRARQLMQWIHQRGVTDFEQMTDLSKALREKLKAVAEVTALDVTVDTLSSDGTRKWLFDLGDVANAIECVYIPEKNRGTLCISSQVGCILNCSFCSTGHQGFNRNLSTAEIISQVFLATHALLADEPIANEKTEIKMTSLNSFSPGFMKYLMGGQMKKSIEKHLFGMKYYIETGKTVNAENYKAVFKDYYYN
ncbi:MAG: hypothetical protein JKY93_00040 [Gammaproteobacteria bacterium]|nr:hypothetical protein [Gammaproteobacteria bacterium]